MALFKKQILEAIEGKCFDLDLEIEQLKVSPTKGRKPQKSSKMGTPAESQDREEENALEAILESESKP